MKILVPINIDRNSVENNPFVDVICAGLQRHGHEVVCSRDLFWKAPYSFDLIFFQWPDEIVLEEHKIKQDVEIIKSHLQTIKKKGIPMVVTVHNLHPHNNNQYLTTIYDVIYSSVDAFHHMGCYSYEHMKQRFPKAYHFIVPHPTYFDDIEVALSPKECKKKYKLPKRKIVVIAFGAFRNNEERKMLINLCHKYYLKCCFFAPKFNRGIGANRSKFSKIFSYIFFRLQGIRMYRGPVSDTNVMEMIKGADILFIQRKDILNSGNLSLGFSAGKIVVGPDMGNVGMILRDTGNPVFNPFDPYSIYNAMDKALIMLKQGNRQGKQNFKYAKDNWTKNHVTDILNKELTQFYKNIVLH